MKGTCSGCRTKQDLVRVRGRVVIASHPHPDGGFGGGDCSGSGEPPEDVDIEGVDSLRSGDLDGNDSGSFGGGLSEW